MFPHIFSHFLTAKDVGSFRYAIILYPLCIAIVWIPSVLLGILGNVDVPGLEGRASKQRPDSDDQYTRPRGLSRVFGGRCVRSDYVLARLAIPCYWEHVHTRYYRTLSARGVFRGTTGLGRTAVCERRALCYLYHFADRNTEHF